MTRIRIDTVQAENVAMRLTRVGHRLHEIRWQLNHAIGQLDLGVWEGTSRARIESQLSRIDPEARKLAGRLDELGRKLMHVADVFEQRDGEAAGNFSGMPWVDFKIATTGAAVLGTIKMAKLSATGEREVSQAKYDAMTWKQRLGKRDKLAEETKRAQDALDKWDQEHADELGGLSLEQVEEYLEHLNGMEAEAEQDIYDMQHPDGFIEWLANQISDSDEQYIASSEEMLRRIREEWRPRWERRRDLLLEQQALEQQLHDFQTQLGQLERQIGEGVPADGPTKESWLMLGPQSLAGCVRYVAEKRNVSSFGNGHPGNASEWRDQAKAAEYEVGQVPVKGSIVVWENNHAAYVEWVDPNNPTHFRVSEAHTVRDPDGGFVRGTYEPKPPEIRDVYLNHETGISFIYNK